ncbi:unnamed protein product, partial [Polarella glacialis]
AMDAITADRASHHHGKDGGSTHDRPLLAKPSVSKPPQSWACDVPVDPVGTWLRQKGSTPRLRLFCADGYEPNGGPAELLCSEPKEPWKTAPA